MFLLVNNFKMIGMLLNVVHGQVNKSEQKPKTKGFPTIPLLLTIMGFVNGNNILYLRFF